MKLTASQLMDQGWKARENLDFKKAERLLLKAQELFIKEKDWFNVTKTLNHLAYTEKLKAVHSNIKGKQYAEEALYIARNKGTKTSAVYRALISLASSAGLFEQALLWSLECLPDYTEQLSRADLLSHISSFYLRTGNIEQAEKTISEAENLIKGVNLNSLDMPQYVWLTRILATKGIILYNKGNKKEAKKYLHEALSLAKDKKLKTRIAEITQYLELFEKQK